MSLYHYGEGATLTLSLMGSHFSGFDYGTHSHFSGNVAGAAVSVYDYEHGQFFSYVV
jgi:hypothetical protein